MLEKIKEPRKQICDHQNCQERPLKIVKMKPNCNTKYPVEHPEI